MFGVDAEERARLREKYLGKKVRVIIDDPYRYINEVGIVERVDDAGQLHGTWGGLAVIPGEDSISMVDDLRGNVTQEIRDYLQNRCSAHQEYDKFCQDPQCVKGCLECQNQWLKKLGWKDNDLLKSAIHFDWE